MKTTLLALTGVACLATSGIAMIAAERSSISSSVTETAGGETGSASQLDRDTHGQYDVRWSEVGSEAASATESSALTDINLDISKDGFLSANELRPYTRTYLARNGYGVSIVDRFDRSEGSVLTTDELRRAPSLR